MLKWIGNTKGIEGIIGIPARDLSEDEVRQHGGEKALLDTGLYEKTALSKEMRFHQVTAEKEGD